MGSNSEIQGYNVYPMLHFHRKFSSSVITDYYYLVSYIPILSISLLSHVVLVTPAYLK